MKVLIEGERYPVEVLKQLFLDPKFYQQEGASGTVLSVGYYYNRPQNIIIYLLPKVFMADGVTTVFGVAPCELLDFGCSQTFRHKNEFLWVRQVSIYFYNSLLEFKKRCKDSSTLNSSLSYSLNTKLGNQEYSYLDLVLSFVNFHKRHKNFIAYRRSEQKTQDTSKLNWGKILRKSTSFFTKDGHPLYSIFKAKKRRVNKEEELLVYFFSILHHLNSEHKLYVRIDGRYDLITGSKFLLLQKDGLARLRAIKYKYFSDTLKRMYHLCELYFSTTDASSLRKPKDEFLSVANYNLVFEDMMDKLFSDEVSLYSGDASPSMKELKSHPDGKILDHIFDYQSLIDTSNIFYIGDSKYYKPDRLAGKLSQCKQFTYAKNVIQFNIDLLNSVGAIGYRPNIRYRDDKTEGYSITPNFFIYGFIGDYKNIDTPDLSERGDVARSYHFEDRLFDRDSLYVHQYMINFLFVLKSYTRLSGSRVIDFRGQVKAMFRSNFLEFFNSEEKSSFQLFEYILSDVSDFLDENFRLLNGKCFETIDGKLIVAKHSNDSSLDCFLGKLSPLKLT